MSQEVVAGVTNLTLQATRAMRKTRTGATSQKARASIMALTRISRTPTQASRRRFLKTTTRFSMLPRGAASGREAHYPHE